MKILVVNAGSSSHKLSLYELQDDQPIAPLWQGEYDWGREDQLPSLEVKTSAGVRWKGEAPDREVKTGLQALLNTLWQGDTKVIDRLGEIERIGHRVVHGGLKFEQPVVIDAAVKEQIRTLIPLAPLHNPANLQGIELMEQLFPALLQVAVFDTAYHATMPEEVKTYPVPWEWKERGIQRYGFHGISHQYCAERAVRFLGKEAAALKIINCHLGNGCSLCAIKEGKSVETTMGLTPLEGLMMGTRCGSIDPGIILYLMREHRMTQEEIDHRLNFGSGLKGIAGYSDMRELLEQSDERAQLAVRMFVHRLRTGIGALAAALGGFNVLSFTAGIGEHAAVIREETCRGLEYLGVVVDSEKNRMCQPDSEISGAKSGVRVIVLHTEEEWMIARACLHASD